MQTVSVTTLLFGIIGGAMLRGTRANVRVVGLLARVATATLIVHHACGL